MKYVYWTLSVIVGFVAVMWVVSHIVDMRRTQKPAPEVFAWNTEIKPQQVEVSGLKVRYIKAGDGPPIILLHTFSTHLSHFQKIIPELAKTNTVYALDLPGFGYSEQPRKPLSAVYYAKFVSGFMDKLKIEKATIAGESIGGSIPLVMSAMGEARIQRIVSINPIGYTTSPPARGSFAGKILSLALKASVIRGILMRLRSERFTRAVYSGAVYSIDNIPEAYFNELTSALQRKDYPETMHQFSYGLDSWMDTVKLFSKINTPVYVLWGEKDWSYPKERKKLVAKIPGASTKTIEKSGHFMSMDRPDAIIAALRK